LPKLRNFIIISASILLFLLLLGIISGNSFLIVIGRAFFGTIVLSSLLAGAYYIMNKIISNIPAAGEEEKQYESVDSDSLSNNVDIVLEKENPFEEENEDLAASGAGSSLSSSRQMESSSPESLVEEVEEDTIGDIGSLDTKTTDDEVIEVMTDNPNNNDSLPAIDSGSDLFGNANEPISSVSRRESEALNSLGDNANPQVIAKAIKTVMTRDDKG